MIDNFAWIYVYCGSTTSRILCEIMNVDYSILDSSQSKLLINIYVPLFLFGELALMVRKSNDGHCLSALELSIYCDINKFIIGFMFVYY